MTQYNSVNETFQVSANTAGSIANAAGLTALVTTLVLAINYVDCYWTDGYTILAVAAATCLGTAAAIAATARWLFTRREVNNTNLQRDNGDQIFRTLVIITIIAAGTAAFTMLLQVMDINTTTLLVAEGKSLYGGAASLMSAILEFIR